MITLYDFPALVPGKACSPNTFKTRLALAFKGLEFKTEWVDLPDVESAMKKLGAKPIGESPGGRAGYTVPVIHDDSTGKIVSDSLKIAEYLDVTYPDKPTLFPFGARAPIHMFNEFFFPTVIGPTIFLFLSGLFDKLNPRTEDYFRKTREPMFGKKLEELVPEGEERVTQFAVAKQNFSKLAAIYAANGDGRPYLYGDVPSYADLIVVSYLLWIQAGLGAENPEWNTILEWDNRKWGDLFDRLKKYNVLS